LVLPDPNNRDFWTPQTSIYFNLLPPSFEEWISQGKQGRPIPSDSLFHPMYHTVDRDVDDDDDDDDT